VSISNPENSQSSLLKPVELHGQDGHQKASTVTLAIAAIGVVFGDIGTSPLYALKESFSPSHGISIQSNGCLWHHFNDVLDNLAGCDI